MKSCLSPDAKKPFACPRLPDALPFAQGLMTQTECEDYLRHSADCPECARAITEIRETLRDLASIPEEKCSPGLTERIVAAAEKESERSRSVIRLPMPAAIAGIAAALLAACGLWIALHSFNAVKKPAASHEAADARAPQHAAVEWLMNAQESDGGWRAGSGTQSVYNAGVSALAMLAIIEAADESPIQRTRETLERGAKYLLSIQDPEGLFGPRCAGAPYNQGLATLAMLEMWNINRTVGSYRMACSKGIAFLRKTQDEQGGWSYLGEDSESANTSASVWPILALLRAKELGFDDLDKPMRRGLEWLRTRVSPDGFMGYRKVNDEPYGPYTLTAAGALCLMKSPYPPDRHAATMMLPIVRKTAAEPFPQPDFYRFFFVTEALKKAGDPSAGPILANLRARIAARQKYDGISIGTWDKGDPWASAGGPVYSTAMAAMTIASAMQ